MGNTGAPASAAPSSPSTPAAASSAPAAAPSTPAAGAGASTTLPVVLKIDFTLITPDGQRKIGFSLEKDSDGTKTTWTISFTLYEMQDGATTFGDPTISLNVVVSPTLNGNAQTVAQNGLTAPQAAHATGPAADSVKALADGTGSHLAASSSIQNTLK
jgi:hypothetical protein